MVWRLFLLVPLLAFHFPSFCVFFFLTFLTVSASRGALWRGPDHHQYEESAVGFAESVHIGDVGNDRFPRAHRTPASHQSKGAPPPLPLPFPFLIWCLLAFAFIQGEPKYAELRKCLEQLRERLRSNKVELLPIPMRMPGAVPNLEVAFSPPLPPPTALRLVAFRPRTHWRRSSRLFWFSVADVTFAVAVADLQILIGAAAAAGLQHAQKHLRRRQRRQRQQQPLRQPAAEVIILVLTAAVLPHDAPPASSPP